MTHNRSLKVLVAPALLMMLFAIGCASAPTAEQPPDGTYRNGDGIELKLAHDQWNVGFAGSTQEIAAGSYKVVGDQITFTEERFGVAATCNHADNSYTYKWKFDTTAKKLDFTNVQDKCGERMGEWTGEPWIQQQ